MGRAQSSSTIYHTAQHFTELHNLSCRSRYHACTERQIYLFSFPNLPLLLDIGNRARNIMEIQGFCSVNWQPKTCKGKALKYRSESTYQRDAASLGWVQEPIRSLCGELTLRDTTRVLLGPGLSSWIPSAEAGQRWGVLPLTAMWGKGTQAPLQQHSAGQTRRSAASLCVTQTASPHCRDFKPDSLVSKFAQKIPTSYSIW